MTHPVPPTDQQGAYATAFLLAMVSVACIVVVAIIRPKNHP